MADLHETLYRLKKYAGPAINTAGRGLGSRAFSHPLETVYTVLTSMITDVTDSKTARALCNLGAVYTGIETLIKTGEAVYKLANGNQEGFTDAVSAAAHAINTACMVQASYDKYTDTPSEYSMKERALKDNADLFSNIKSFFGKFRRA